MKFLRENAGRLSAQTVGLAVGLGISLVAPDVALCQQEPLFTQYFFNSIVFNPAYAGSNEHLAANLIHRQQWLGIEGAPQTQALNVHAPVNDKHVGLGASILNDKTGASGFSELAGIYAYRFETGENSKLSLGLQASIGNWHGDWQRLRLEQPTDAVFQGTYSRWLPNFGAGAYWYGEKFYLGIGCPRLIEYDLRKAKNETEGLHAKIYRHFYASGGVALPLGGNEDLIFRPSFLLKTTNWFSKLRKNEAFQNIGAPTALNLDASLFIRQHLWLGGSLRIAANPNTSTGDAFGVWTAWCLDNGLRLGAAYDFPVGPIKTGTAGSFELMTGYEFDVKIKRVVPPRYF